MRIGAKIMLCTGLDAARDGLADLADARWLMGVPLQREAHHGHPAGAARPDRPRPGSRGWLVAVTFGALEAGPGSWHALPVHWEPVEAGDALGVLLAGAITPVGAKRGTSSLELTGFCRLLPQVDGACDQVRLDLAKEAARSFITTVAAAVVTAATTDGKKPPAGPGWAWLGDQESAI